MITKILRVVAQSEPVYVPSKKQESGKIAKCMIRLKELGGEYEDEFVGAMFGNLAQCIFAPDSLVVAAMRFQSHESNGAYYQDIVVMDVQKIN